MRVLLREAHDSRNLCCMEVTLVGYEEEADELWFHGSGEDAAMIPCLGPADANAIIHTLYEKGMKDLREYPAYINEER